MDADCATSTSQIISSRFVEGQVRFRAVQKREEVFARRDCGCLKVKNEKRARSCLRSAS